MKLPNWLKISWLIILIIFFSYLVTQRYDSILEGNSTTTDIFIFLIWVALITAPLFRSVNIFGVGFKNEFDNFKNEVRGQILNIRSDIQNKIDMRAEISSQIYLQMPKDSELLDIKEGIQPIIAESLKEYGIEKPTPAVERQLVPEYTMYLFSVRYAIENELNRIINALTRFDDTFKKNRPRTILQMLDFAKFMGWAKQDYFLALRDILAIGNEAIHGGDISKEKINFVRDVAPGLIEVLKLKADELWSKS